MGIEKLESQAGIMRILLVLKNGELTLSDLMNQAGINQTAAYNSVRKLVKMGWIAENKQKDFPFKRTFKLTKKGTKAESIVQALDNLCN